MVVTIIGGDQQILYNALSSYPLSSTNRQYARPGLQRTLPAFFTSLKLYDKDYRQHSRAVYSQRRGVSRSTGLLGCMREHISAMTHTRSEQVVGVCFESPTGSKNAGHRHLIVADSFIIGQFSPLTDANTASNTLPCPSLAWELSKTLILNDQLTCVSLQFAYCLTKSMCLSAISIHTRPCCP